METATDLEMPTIIPIHQQTTARAQTNKKNSSYFSDLPTNIVKKESLHSSKSNLDFLEEFKDHVNLLKESNIKLPEIEKDNTDSYVKVRRIIFGQAIKYNIQKIEKIYTTFSDIVDIDEEGIDSYIKENLATRFGEGNFFRLCMFIAIIINSIIIGLETDENLEANGILFFTLVDYIFLSIFIMEILFKWFYNFFDFWKNSWNVFDFVIILLASIGPGFTFLTNTRVLRILKVIRTLRSIKSVAFIQGLDMVVSTIIDSIPGN
ncbi:hypothetical protein HDU92_006063 [Lobulomyces angularis]|nr:hypothetical protein HDU92_006063 [Lobulomyces angularis]